jgi:hypothetical protein
MAEPTITRFDVTGSPVLAQFLGDNKHRIQGVMGPFGSGKSSACVAKLLKIAHEQKPGRDGIRRSRFAIVRNTYGQLQDTTIRTVHQWLPPGTFGKWNATEHNFTITAFNGVITEWWFRALDREDHVKKLLSLELTGAWVNEAREVPKSIIDGLDGRCGRFPSMKDGVPATWDGIIMDTNPPDEDSWWFEMFELKRPPNAWLYKQPPAVLVDIGDDGEYIFKGTNPKAENLNNLKAGYYENLVQGKSRDYVKVYVLNEYGFSLDGRPVFPEYKDAIHFSPNITEPIEGLPVMRGWDFGRTPACVFLQRDPLGHINVFDEMYQEDTGIDQFSDRVVQYCNTRYPRFRFEDIGDPAGAMKGQNDEKTAFGILAAKKILIRPGLQKFSGPVGRHEAVRKGLTTLLDGKPMLRVGPKAKLVRKGFMGGYQYRRLKTPGTERFADVPDKNQFSHPHDALQYAMTQVIYGYLSDMVEEPYAELPQRQPDEDGFYF